MTTAPTRPVPTAPKTIKARVAFGAPVKGYGHRILLYGPGGWGKTTLSAKAPGNVVFVDLDESLGRLGMDAKTVTGIETWAQLRTALQSDGWDGVDTIIVDTATKAEELAIAHTLLTVKHEKGGTCDGIEGYGFGKGYTHVFETFMGLLVDLDKHARAGRNVILIAHDCVATVPNPAGEDWIRYEPRLQSPATGKSSIRLRVKEWCDHVLFGGYDVVAKGKKGQGSGTRTLYTQELPSCMAKSRTCPDQLVITQGNEEDVWASIIK